MRRPDTVSSCARLSDPFAGLRRRIFNGARRKGVFCLGASYWSMFSFWTRSSPLWVVSSALLSKFELATHEQRVVVTRSRCVVYMFGDIAERRSRAPDLLLTAWLRLDLCVVSYADQTRITADQGWRVLWGIALVCQSIV